jgi:hypothetical protein
MKSMESLVAACRAAMGRGATPEVKSSLVTWLRILEDIQVRSRSTQSARRVR